MTTVEVASSLSEISAASALLAPRKSSSYAASSSRGSKIGCLATNTSDTSTSTRDIGQPRGALDSLVEKRDDAHQRGREDEGRQEVAHLDVLESQELQRYPDDEHATGAHERVQRLAALGQYVLEKPCSERYSALDHEHG